MIHRYRRHLLLVGVIAGLLAAPAGALAAVQPDADAHRSLHRRRDAAARRRCGGHVTASRARRSSASSTARPAPTASRCVEGLPIETGEGEPVVVDVVVDKATTVVDEESGCVSATRGMPSGTASRSTTSPSRSSSPPTSSRGQLDRMPAGPAPADGRGAGSGRDAGTDVAADRQARECSDGGTAAVVVAAGLVGLSAGLLMLLPSRRHARGSDRGIDRAPVKKADVSARRPLVLGPFRAGRQSHRQDVELANSRLQPAAGSRRPALGQRRFSGRTGR